MNVSPDRRREGFVDEAVNAKHHPSAVVEAGSALLQRPSRDHIQAAITEGRKVGEGDCVALGRSRSTRFGAEACRTGGNVVAAGGRAEFLTSTRPDLLAIQKHVAERGGSMATGERLVASLRDHRRMVDVFSGP